MTKEKITTVAKLTSKNQVTIPKPIRKLLDVQSRNQIIFQTTESGDITIKAQDRTHAFWDKVEEEQAKYGPLDREEVFWGEDIEAEEFDL